MAAKRKRSPKNPNKPRKPGKRSGQARIDWAAAELRYVSSLAVTYEDVAEEFGCHPNTVRNKASEGDWTTKRRQHREEAVQKGLELALEQKREGAAAIIHLEYTEAMTCVSHLQALRMREAARWRAKDHSEYLRAFALAMKQARLACGLPTEIQANTTEARQTYEDAVKRARARREDGDEWPEGI